MLEDKVIAEGRVICSNKMSSSVLNEYIMVRKGVYCAVGEYSYFCFTILLYPVKVQRFIGAKQWIYSKITLEQWCHWNIQSQELLCYFLYGIWYLGRIPILIKYIYYQNIRHINTNTTISSLGTSTHDVKYLYRLWA